MICCGEGFVFVSPTRVVSFHFDFWEGIVAAFDAGNRSDDSMPDGNFQVLQRLTSDLTPTPQQCDKEIDNSANRADQQSARHVRSWLQQCKMKSLP